MIQNEVLIQNGFRIQNVPLAQNERLIQNDSVLPTVCTDQFSGPFVALVHFCVKNSRGRRGRIESGNQSLHKGGADRDACE